MKGFLYAAALLCSELNNKVGNPMVLHCGMQIPGNKSAANVKPGCKCHFLYVNEQVVLSTVVKKLHHKQNMKVNVTNSF